MYVCETCGYESKDAKKMKEHEMAHMNLTAEEVRQSEKIYMKNKVYLIWLINDDVDPMVVGIATSEDKANSMRDKLASTDGFEFNDYEIIEMNADTVIIDDVEYRF